MFFSSQYVSESFDKMPVHDRSPESKRQPIRAIVADDHPVMRQALVSCLLSLPGVEVVGTASNGQEALAKSAELKPDLVVADLLMPVMNGFELLKALRETYPAIRLVAVSGHNSSAIATEAVSAGANAFIPKNGLPQDLIHALEDLL